MISRLLGLLPPGSSAQSAVLSPSDVLGASLTHPIRIRVMGRGLHLSISPTVAGACHGSKRNPLGGLLKGRGFSGFGKSCDAMKKQTTALMDAVKWLETLLDSEHRGRHDTEGAARYRLSCNIGVKESYLFRLQYKAAEMTDVAGEVYRRLLCGYVYLCRQNEAAAEAYRAETLRLLGKIENETVTLAANGRSMEGGAYSGHALERIER